MLIFIVFLFIATVAAFVILLFLTSRSAPKITSSSKNSGNLLSACPCNSPYECDISGICKVPIGGNCNSLFECVTSANFCDISCGISKTGGINQPINPVTNPTECNSVNLVNINGICKGKIDTPCSIHEDCETFVCNNNKCSNKIALTKECVFTEQCADPNATCIQFPRCSNNTLPINSECPSGTYLIESSCQLHTNEEPGAPCNTNFDCHKTSCINGICG